MNVVGETSGQQKDFLEIIERARRELQDYAAVGGDPAPLVENSPRGVTPLILAAMFGYGDIVAELLKNERVVSSINDVDQRGFSAWAYANFALRETIWVCNSTVFKDPFKFVPSLVTLPFYQGGGERPYRKTRRVLEEAGAKKDMAAAKQLWLDTCKLATHESRQKVADADDLLVTVEEEGEVILEAVFAATNKP